jgi:hypothetical protein
LLVVASAEIADRGLNIADLNDGPQNAVGTEYDPLVCAPYIESRIEARPKNVLTPKKTAGNKTFLGN